MSIKKSKIIYSEEFNPWYNLALEEYLLNSVDDDEIILYLWQNDNTVVIGRNQNAWKECRCSLLEEENDGYLARRLSGGGAVYHDMGNLNFTFLMDRDSYNLKKQLSVILEAVKGLGIDAEFSGRNDLVIGEKKFSGNAFYFGSKKAYHHGTILLDTDIKSLVEYLQVSKEKIISKGIESVRSRVVNLKEINDKINLDSLKEKLEKSFSSIYVEPEEILHYTPSEMPEIADLYEKYSSWDWRYGETTEFDIIFSNRFDWGEVEIALNSVNAVIEKAKVYSDAMEAELFAELGPVLEGVRFTKENIIETVKGLKDKGNKEMISDLVDWIKKRDF
ncbi:MULTISPECIES: lipoate--protein ligase [unclassified Halanaerobium]|uniref:lipoate--protein ligase n=1 Tax=unclassified Halanaerobium TaxID=2641197 RepID=UPI000DF49F09|nr:MULTISPECIES: lipoate--protein ligase [unclassified Halanaerobium]RCW47355.1 lipoate-protein ligase [Halanaerobium sp. MA284_MarDTE_T2]RCW84894.1 lipoate-protein ligase [Halanaerobium sp. DL-01]